MEKEMKIKSICLIFNVCKDIENNYTRFMLSIENRHIECWIVGVENDLESLEFEVSILCDSFDFEPDDILYLAGKEYQIFDENSLNE